MSGDEPYRWSQGLMLTPDQYVKLGMAMQALGPRVTELANEPLAVEHRQLTEQELSELTGAISEADREQVTPPVSYRRDLDLASPELENFRQVWDMSNEAELTRVEQDAQPLPRLAEDRMAYLVDRAANRTLVPQGPAAYGLANQPDPMAATTGGMPCGVIDATGRCGERYHAATCNSLADPFIAQTLRPQMEQIAARPWADVNGQVWYDQEHNAPMSLVDHIEAARCARPSRC
jgi:hypothetical protein